MQDADMNLPEGKRCYDCQSFKMCAALFGCQMNAKRCDWAPHRFVELTTEQREARNAAALAKLREDLDRAEWARASPLGKSL